MTNTDFHDTDPTGDFALLRRAIVDLTNVVKSDHNDNKQLFTLLCEEISTMVTKMATETELLSDAACTKDQKKWKKHGLRHFPHDHADFIKAKVALKLVDVSKGTNFFQRTPSAATYIMVLLAALEKVMRITSEEGIVALLNKRVQLWQSTLYVITYLYRASGHLHDSVLLKFCNAFFAGLPEDKLLSANVRLSHAEKGAFARRVDNSKEYYHSAEYNVAWQNACHSALQGKMYAGSTAYHNIRRQNPECDISVLPDHPKQDLLVFVVLKVSSHPSLFISFCITLLSPSSQIKFRIR